MENERRQELDRRMKEVQLNKLHQQKEFTRQFGQVKCERFDENDCDIISDTIGVCGWDAKSDRCKSSYKIGNDNTKHDNVDKSIRDLNPKQIAFNTDDPFLTKLDFMDLLRVCKKNNVSKEATVMLLKIIYLSNGENNIEDIKSRASKIMGSKNVNPLASAKNVLWDMYVLKDILEKYGSTALCFAVVIYEHYYELENDKQDGKIYAHPYPDIHYYPYKKGSPMELLDSIKETSKLKGYMSWKLLLKSIPECVTEYINDMNQRNRIKADIDADPLFYQRAHMGMVPDKFVNFDKLQVKL